MKCCFLPTAQRSAQELPLVEKQSVESYPAAGGKMMLLSGLNFLPDSKVVFVEKAQGELTLPPPPLPLFYISLIYVFALSSSVAFPPVSPPVKIDQALPESHMWCALGHYIFNQSVFTFTEVSIACSLVLATSSGMNHKKGMCSVSFSHSLYFHRRL